MADAVQGAEQQPAASRASSTASEDYLPATQDSAPPVVWPR